MHPGTFKPQTNEANNRRPLTPFLSFGQLGPFEDVGDGNLTSPMHLTPPVHGHVSSPPPRKERDGYFGPSAHQHARRKSPTTSGVRSQSPLRETGSPTLDQPAGDHDSVADSAVHGSSEKKFEDFFMKPAGLSSQKTMQKPLTIRFETFARTVFTEFQQASSDSTTKDKSHIHDSTAMRSLRRLSESRIHLEALDCPEMVQSVADTLKNLDRFNSLGVFESSSNEDEATAGELSQMKSKRRKSHAAGNRRRANPTGNSNIPATITLRKASEVFQSDPKTSINKETVTAEILHENSPALRTVGSALACRSRNFDPERLPSFEGRETRKVSFARDSNDEDEAERQRAKSVAGSAGNSIRRRQSLLAETAVTMEDVHLGPGKFAFCLNSRRHSVSAATSLRRLSTIQAGFRGSVHEVIWQEDGPSSGTSSLPSVSPTRKDSLLGNNTYGTQQQSGEAESIVTELVSWPTTISRQNSSSGSKPNVFQNAVLRLKQSYGNIFNWSWDERHLGEAQSASQPKISRTATAPESTSDPQGRRSSIAQSLRIQSFPPLRQRSHTSDWRKAPLPDLNDPTTGRAPAELLDFKHPDDYGSLMDGRLQMYSSIPNTVSASVDSNVDADSVSKIVDVYSKFPQPGNKGTKVDGSVELATKGSKNVAYASSAHTKLSEEGRAGSAVGVSSHRRVVR